jgi:hypothetical protein
MVGFLGLVIPDTLYWVELRVKGRLGFGDVCWRIWEVTSFREMMGHTSSSRVKGLFRG